MPPKATPEHPYVRIWQTVASIPRGKVASYGAIASLSGLPGQARLAGYALHNLPPGNDIPWHRVLNVKGEISLRGDAGASQRRRLESEGVFFRNGKVDMERSGWNPARKKKQGTRKRTNKQSG